MSPVLKISCMKICMWVTIGNRTKPVAPECLKIIVGGVWTTIVKVEHFWILEIFFGEFHPLIQRFSSVQGPNMRIQIFKNITMPFIKISPALFQIIQKSFDTILSNYNFKGLVFIKESGHQDLHGKLDFIVGYLPNLYHLYLLSYRNPSSMSSYI